MAVKYLLFAILVAVVSKGETLSCLHCNGVYQPRHCRAVVDCFKGEVCGVEKVLNSYGEYIYNLGCIAVEECGNNHVVNASNTGACRQCCESDLCNSEGCGEPGYPVSRGPICYSCTVHREGRPCHNIDFCKIGEMCLFQETEEFGDSVVKAQCTNAHSCPDVSHSILVGRNTDNMQKTARSAEQHICDACCSNDLCNKDCYTAHQSSNTISTKSTSPTLPTTNEKTTWTSKTTGETTPPSSSTTTTSTTSPSTTTTTTTPTQSSQPQYATTTTTSLDHSFNTTTIGVLPTTIIDGNSVLAIFGHDMVTYMRFNKTRVIRGRDWKWDNQDGNGMGTILRWDTHPLWVEVKWDNNGKKNTYRMGAEGGKYDLYIVSI